MKEASFYRPLEDRTTECLLCPHGCRIPQGGRGLCGVRCNQDGVLMAESCGRVTAVALDPIEKKPLHRFHSGSRILSLGSYGCNFRCGSCQNHRISMEEATFRTMTPDQVAAMSLELVPQGNIGVAYTYNEPLIGYEFVRDCAGIIAGQGQKNVLVTNGFVCREPLEQLLPLIHAMNIDLKSFHPTFYRDIGGGLDDVLRTIKIAASRCHVEVTTLIIPGKNDSDQEMESLSRWLGGIDENIPLHISRFFPAHQLRDVPATPVETVYRLAEVARQSLRHVISGNC